jgi:hypothetical protein
MLKTFVHEIHEKHEIKTKNKLKQISPNYLFLLLNFSCLSWTAFFFPTT